MTYAQVFVASWYEIGTAIKFWERYASNYSLFSNQ